MTDSKQEQLGNTFWGITDPLRAAMDADDFRGYLPSFQLIALHRHADQGS